MYVSISKDFELHVDDVSLRSIAMITQHSRQKITEIIALAKQKGVKIPLEEKND